MKSYPTHDGMHRVYRLFDRDGRLLYVGCTSNLQSRVEQHRYGKSWGGEIALVTWTTWRTARIGYTMESATIWATEPLHNTRREVNFSAWCDVVENLKSTADRVAMVNGLAELIEERREVRRRIASKQVA